MNIKEIMNNNPLAKEIIKSWFLEKMIDSLKTETVTDDFKKMIRERGVEDEHIFTLIDVNPRSLFDVLDINDIKVLIDYNDKLAWGYSINKGKFTYLYNNRKDAELNGIIRAINILNIKSEKENETNNRESN